MHVIYEAIQLDPSLPAVPVCGSEWAINPRHNTLHHGPTKTVFEVFLKEQTAEAKMVRSMDFYSLLVAIADGCALPPPEVIEMLGRQAIALYLMAFGYLKPKEEMEESISTELLEKAHAC
jgi:hypothetical protein